MAVMEYEDAGNLAITPEVGRNGHMEFGRIEIR
jgi:hypothetical protein